MLFDFHAHSSAISKCCRIPIEEVIDTAIRNRIDGIILTNHYQKNYVSDGDYEAFAKRYMEEYYHASQIADQLGYTVFFGIEATMEQYPGVHLLIYGVDEHFIERYPLLFDFSQEELYRVVKDNGGIVIQAHPYRQNNNRLLDTAFLDGIEISCHPLYEGTHLEKLTEVAQKSNLILTCGGDYHADTHRPHCGVYIPDSISDVREMAEYLTSIETIRLCVQEIDEMKSHDVIFCRGMNS